MRKYTAEEIDAIKQFYFESTYIHVMPFLHKFYPDLYEDFKTTNGEPTKITHWNQEKRNWLELQQLQKETYATLLQQINEAKLDMTTAIQEKLASLVYAEGTDLKQLDQIVGALDKLVKIQATLINPNTLKQNAAKITVYDDQKRRVDILLSSALMEETVEDEDGLDPNQPNS